MHMGRRASSHHHQLYRRGLAIRGILNLANFQSTVERVWLVLLELLWLELESLELGVVHSS